MSNLKGILLAGGSGSRLFPLTAAFSKHLLPVYDKPLIHYPLATLMLAGVRDILVITTPSDRALISGLLGDGGSLGINLTYAEQQRPSGIAEALLIGRDFLAGDPVVLALGDNIFFGHGLPELLARAKAQREGATIFAYWVADPKRFGVVELAGDHKVIGIEEKPLNPRSNYAVTGLYFFDGRASDLAAELQPSARGELEITDLVRRYLEMGQLQAQRLGRGFAWMDAGTPDALLDSANYVATIERRQGLKIACVEEIAWRMGWIDEDALMALADTSGSGNYGDYLRGIVTTA
ncbi:MAG: glucose-1-phosphate thymidylyltransferase RfbA [Rhodospirillaceae bacterium]|nr:glucose-1-phosphate thymidylyltransferase RfbA [Rhodospirillaceae bacterium]MBT4489605.1 glucose-1-phosphate thymidylyltransferase RfbA [Rhodospirillaceae bacterium]MBT5194601.1 glucose-1-phosphate thymidylyltransferase RfbA [Rhodospirillaceae bacterium]MBT6427547.1 glucose-1-phosphate thymidylyltransferase RfbA [Rhodospirillaceae bacterium]